MAIIYDLATGRVISPIEAVRNAGKPRQEPACSAEPQLEPDTTRYPDDTNPCDAYMVLLQRLLKDL